MDEGRGGGSGSETGTVGSASMAVSVGSGMADSAPWPRLSDPTPPVACASVEFGSNVCASSDPPEMGPLVALVWSLAALQLVPPRLAVIGSIVVAEPSCSRTALASQLKSRACADGAMIAAAMPIPSNNRVIPAIRDDNKVARNPARWLVHRH